MSVWPRPSHFRRTASLILSHRVLVLGTLAAMEFVGCGPGESGGEAPVAAALPSPASRPRIVALGDSLTAGYGLAPGEAYPALLQARLDAERYDVEVVNAGVSGETSAGGLRRLDWVLQGDVRILILELGGNDGLRGLPVDELRRNLAQIITQAESRRIRVVLAGMEAPPNLGPLYTTAFRRAYRDLASEYRCAFIPFLLQGVAGVPAFNQRDGMHPNAAGARIVFDNLWPVLKPLVERIVGR